MLENNQVAVSTLSCDFKVTCRTPTESQAKTPVHRSHDNNILRSQDAGCHTFFRAGARKNVGTELT